MNDKKALEENLNFTPKFNNDGLIPCIASCKESGEVLMFAYMNEEALHKTIETGEAHYWSRSRKELWHKGATSGHVQYVTEMRTDCDQDCIWIKVKTDVGSCHTGRKSCFYRAVVTKDQLEFTDADKVFNPDDVYKNQ